MIYGGKELQSDKLLLDYGLTRDSTIFLVMRLRGGAAILAKQDRSIPAGIKQSNDESCMICFETPSMLMPCNHTMHPHCLVNYAWNEVTGAGRKSEIKCPVCTQEWSMPVLKKYGKTVDAEVRLLEDALSRNAIARDQKISECPGCGGYCERLNTSTIRVSCRICQSNRKPDFCWICKRKWTGKTNEKCGYADCDSSGILAQIKSAPMKVIVGVQNCPSIRLCPKCGAAIEHRAACKHMTCKCGAEFCFICLRVRMESSWQCGSYNTKCSPAPVQDTVPKPKLNLI